MIHWRGYLRLVRLVQHFKKIHVITHISRLKKKKKYENLNRGRKAFDEI